jgi:large subunit ribosomal protein L35e
VAQVTNGAASKLAKIRVVRKNIARVLTVMNQKSKAEMRKQVLGLQRIPKQLRAKKTRALRRALTPAEKAIKTKKALSKAANFPQRRYALKA